MIIDQTIENPNFSPSIAIIVKVFRVGTVCRQVCSEADRNEHCRDPENVRKISLLSAWHNPC